MRIGFFCCTFGKSGGMETYALNLIQAAIALGHKPIVFCMKSDPELKLREQCEVVEYKIPSFIPNKLGVYLFHRWLISESAKHNLDLSIGCCTGGLPTVIACGGTKVGYLKAMGKIALPLDQLIMRIEESAYSAAKIIVAHSKMMASELEKYYKINNSKIHVIYPPEKTSQSLERYDKNKLREKYGIKEEETVFLFPSSSHKRKGLDIIRDYFTTNKTHDLLLVAGKPAKEEGNIRSLGFCENMQELYQLADYTVLASRYEPLGLVAAESILNGTPVIISKNSGCCEALSEKAIRTFDPFKKHDFEDLVAKVKVTPPAITPPFSRYISPEFFETPCKHLEKIITLTQGE